MVKVKREFDELGNIVFTPIPAYHVPEPQTTPSDDELLLEQDKKEGIVNVNPLYPLRNSIPAQFEEGLVLNSWRNSISCIWEQAVRCPCVDVQSNSPRPNCPVCHGQGYFFPQKYRLDFMIQSDKNNNRYDGFDASYMPGSLATPQITVNGIEDSIKPGDRITVTNWYTAQNYTINVTQSRLKDGMFLPYRVGKIRHAYDLTDGKLNELDVEKSFEIDDNNFLKFLDESLLDKTITFVLAIEKRFYVSSLVKELRYTNFDRIDYKKWATGRGNDNLVFEQLKDNMLEYNGRQIFKQPSLLLLRRETLFFPDVNLIEKETDNNMVVKDPRSDALSDWLNGQ